MNLSNHNEINQTLYVLLGPKFDFSFMKDDQWEIDKRNAFADVVNYLINRGTHVSGIYLTHGFEYDFTQIIVLFFTYFV